MQDSTRADGHRRGVGRADTGATSITVTAKRLGPGDVDAHAAQEPGSRVPVTPADATPAQLRDIARQRALASAQRIGFNVARVPCPDEGGKVQSEPGVGQAPAQQPPSAAATTRRLGSVEALLPPEHRIIIVAGAAAEFLDGPFPGEEPLCYAGDDILYLVSASGCYHYARVVLEAWDGTPPADTADWEVGGQVTLLLSDGTAHISGMLEFPASPTLAVGPPGRYHAHVHATGRTELLRLQRQPGRPIPMMDVECFRVRFWPAAPRRE